MRFFDMSLKPAEAELADVPLGGTRAQAMQRLQIGIAGVVLMILMVGLASIIQNRAELSDATAVPQAAPTTEPTANPEQNDPLAEAGVVPNMPSDAETGPARPAGPVAGRTPAGPGGN